MNKKQRKQRNRVRTMLNLLAAKLSGKITAEQFKKRLSELRPSPAATARAGGE